MSYTMGLFIAASAYECLSYRLCSRRQLSKLVLDAVPRIPCRRYYAARLRRAFQGVRRRIALPRSISITFLRSMAA